MSARADSRERVPEPRGPRIILIGLRCSGKTTVARILGARIGLPVVDLDVVTLHDLGRSSVQEAWRALGEPAWREAETQALGRALRESAGILALGGGTPMIESAAITLSAYRTANPCIIAYLRARPETLAKRIGVDGKDRPSLTGRPADLEMQSVFNQRDARYAGLADVTIDTDEMNAEETAQAIMQFVSSDR